MPSLPKRGKFPSSLSVSTKLQLSMLPKRGLNHRPMASTILPKFPTYLLPKTLFHKSNHRNMGNPNTRTMGFSQTLDLKQYWIRSLALCGKLINRMLQTSIKLDEKDNHLSRYYYLHMKSFRYSKNFIVLLDKAYNKVDAKFTPSKGTLKEVIRPCNLSYISSGNALKDSININLNSKASLCRISMAEFKSRLKLVFFAKPFSTSTSLTSPTSIIDPTFLLRLCTILYQQQNAPLSKLQSHLHKLHFTPTNELFIQLCNKFPYSWRPIHNFHLYSKLTHNFTHTSGTANKALDVFGKACNIELMHNFLHDMSQERIINQRSIEIAATHLAGAREIKKCVEIFELDASFKNVDVLNRVISSLCALRYVDVAKAIVSKVKASIQPNGTTYGFLIVGFCRAGDLVAAAKIWNNMLGLSLEPDVCAYNEIVVTLFKNNRFEDAMALFKMMRKKRFCDLGLPSYRLVISWLSKEGRISYVYMVLCEMLKRGVGVDNATLGALIYGLLVRRKVREGYKILQGIEGPDISIYHGLMKGLLRLRMAGEATQVFREMVKRGCEPIMHTYIMLLQGHLGKRGRKGRDPLVNFESIFVGGLVKAGKTLQATKYVERMKWGGVEVPRFDYNNFLHCFSNEEGVVMFEEVGKKLREVGLVDLGDIFFMYGERMSTRDRRRRARVGCSETTEDCLIVG